MSRNFSQQSKPERTSDRVAACLQYCDPRYAIYEMEKQVLRLGEQLQASRSQSPTQVAAHFHTITCSHVPAPTATPALAPGHAHEATATLTETRIWGFPISTVDVLSVVLQQWDCSQERLLVEVRERVLRLHAGLANEMVGLCWYADANTHADAVADAGRGDGAENESEVGSESETSSDEAERAEFERGREYARETSRLLGFGRELEHEPEQDDEEENEDEVPNAVWDGDWEAPEEADAIIDADWLAPEEDDDEDEDEERRRDYERQEEERREEDHAAQYAHEYHTAHEEPQPQLASSNTSTSRCTLGMGPGPRGEPTCGICREEITTDKPTLTHELCQVTFCADCLHDWVYQLRQDENPETCPMDRRLVDTGPTPPHVVQRAIDRARERELPHQRESENEPEPASRPSTLFRDLLTDWVLRPLLRDLFVGMVVMPFARRLLPDGTGIFAYRGRVSRRRVLEFRLGDVRIVRVFQEAEGRVVLESFWRVASLLVLVGAVLGLVALLFLLMVGRLFGVY